MIDAGRSPAAREQRWSRSSPALLLFGQAVLGLLLGVLWWALTRHPADWLVGEPVVTSSTSYPIARDGTYAVLTALAGVVAGVLVLLRAGSRPVTVFAAALAGAVAGSLLGAGAGAALPPSAPADPAHVTLQAWVVVLVWPLALSLVVALVTLAASLVDWVRHPG